MYRLFLAHKGLPELVSLSCCEISANRTTQEIKGENTITLVELPMRIHTIKQAFYKSIPVLAGYVVLGIGFEFSCVMQDMVSCGRLP